MHTSWPLKDGSVLTSWYPVIVVVKTTSPAESVSAPNPRPRKTRPSARASAASCAGRKRPDLESPAEVMHYLAFNYCHDRPTGHLHAEQRRVLRFRLQGVFGDGPAVIRVDDRQVRDVARFDAAARQVPDPRRLGREAIDYLLDCQM